MAAAIMPDIWSDGKLFAYSGLDGPTSWAHTLVGGACTDPFGIALHLGPDLMLAFGGRLEAQDGRLVLGDAAHLGAQTGDGAGDLRLAFADCWTLAGQVTGSLSVRLHGPPQTEAGFVELLTAERDGLIRWCLALSPDSGREARRRAEAGMAADLDALIAARARFVRDLDASGLAEGADERTFRKCAEVLKLNARAPEGRIGRRWTTPDVWPHRHMWLWDSAFHAIGWRELDGEMAQDAILAVIELQEPDGKIHLCDAPQPQNQRHTQPPVLAWSAWRVFEATGDRDFLRACYEPLGRFIAWLFAHRDINGNGLLEWLKEFRVERCRCGESGWDNSPRFDREIIDDHIDINAMAVQEMQMLARMAEALGYSSDWQARADALAARVNERLWHEEIGLYFDRGPGEDPGEWMTMKSAACFLPLIAGIPTQEQARCMVEEHLTNEREFWGDTPVPTVAFDEPQYSDDMWRGPTWMNVNFLIWEGLHRYGFHDIAAELRRRSMAAIEKWYCGVEAALGGVFEYYDPRGAVHPFWLHRKGGQCGIGGISVIRDYGWTAATYVAWCRRGEAMRCEEEIAYDRSAD
ncbi:MAG: amylo-alpha-1,6-glucosidase [Armatimonadota bacterium]